MSSPVESVSLATLVAGDSKEDFFPFSVVAASLFIHLSIYPSVYLCVHPPMHSSITHPSVPHSPTHPPIYHLPIAGVLREYPRSRQFLGQLQKSQVSCFNISSMHSV